MRFIFSITGLLILLAIVFIAGQVGVGTLSEAGQAVGQVVRDAASPSQEDDASHVPEEPVAPTASSSWELDKRSEDDSWIHVPPRDPSIPELGMRFTYRPTASAPAAGAAGSESVKEQGKAELQQAMQRVDFRTKPDGVFHTLSDDNGVMISVMSKGVAHVPLISGSRGHRLALNRSQLIARAALARWLETRVVEKVYDRDEYSYRIADSATGSQEEAQQRTTSVTTRVEIAHAILRGVVTVHQEIVPTDNGEEAITVLGVSRKTLAAAMSAQGRLESPDAPSAPTAPSRDNGARRGSEQRWQISRQEMTDMGF